MYYYRISTAVTLPSGNEPCNIAYESIPSVSSSKCCVISGAITSSKFLPELNMVINPVPKYYLDVCKNFCINGFDPIDQTCLDEEGLQDFNNCVNASQPKNCVGIAMPVATDGLTLYYPNEATNNNCLNQQEC